MSREDREQRREPSLGMPSLAQAAERAAAQMAAAELAVAGGARRKEVKTEGKAGTNVGVSESGMRPAAKPVTAPPATAPIDPPPETAGRVSAHLAAAGIVPRGAFDSIDDPSPATSTPRGGQVGQGQVGKAVGKPSQGGRSRAAGRGEEDTSAAMRTPPPRSVTQSLRKPEEIGLFRLPQVRVLPVMIFVAVLMLSVRVNDIWRGISVAQSRAQQPAAASTTKPPAAPALPAPSAAGASAEGAKAASEAGAAKAATDPVPLPPAPDGTEPTFSQTEVDVLQKLAERRTEIEGRGKEMDTREALLKAAESRIDKKIAEMKTLQGTIEGLLKQYNEQEDAKMRSLVKIYENMKPKEAAKIFEQLDMPVMLDVIERMKEAKVAPIMAEMDPSKAKSLTSELAQRRQIPLPK